MSKKNETMTYKGYVAKPYFSDEDDAFVCVIRAGRDMISFHGNTVQNLKREFHLAVDDYLKGCKEDGITPGKMHSGQFNVRIDPEIHASLDVIAKNAGKKLNTLVAEALSKYVTRKH